MSFDAKRYQPVPAVDFPERTWPQRRIVDKPIWCSVDLRDGNQALVEPMGYERKIRLFKTLVEVGFKQIEVGFPAASETEFDFIRRLIDEGHIPADVTIQVLVQARKDLIERTVAALRGVPRAIIHLYNSTSTLQRRVVFGKDRPEIMALAVRGTEWILDSIAGLGKTEITLEYSPESFTGTELDFAVEVCAAVAETWGASAAKQMIVNLPATVEMTTPNVYADQIEWVIRHLSRREACVVSVHTHNDRGTAVAATELALLAGAERVEGTLFGNGERTGNVDLVTVAMNMYSQGIDPGLALGNLPQVAQVYEQCCRMPIHPRHPYVGELVFTAFSGSHQDAIRKGLDAMRREAATTWAVPYLPIDPADVGREYEALVRINSQSGKGGVAFVLDRTAGYRVPKSLAAVFSQSIQRVTDASGSELTPSQVVEQFRSEYLSEPSHVRLETFDIARRASAACDVRAKLDWGSRSVDVSGHGNGPIDAFVHAVNAVMVEPVHCVDYAEHALGAGEDAEAVSYVQLSVNGSTTWGVGQAPDIVAASLRAVVSAMDRLGVTPRPRVPTADRGGAKTHALS
jgi:2-isopropylmalate synthase